MRVLFFILIMLAGSAAAQTPFISQSFEAATRDAQAQNFAQALEKYQSIILHAASESVDDAMLARTHFNIGVCYYKLKDPAAAVKELTAAIDISKGKYQKAFYVLGMAQIDLKDWSRAETALRKAADLKAGDGEAWFDLALVFLREKNFDQAEKAFENAIKYKSTGAADAHNNLGVIFALKHDFLTAESEFVAALKESGGTSIEAKNNLQFCRTYQRNSNQELLARLEFRRRD